MHKAYSQCSHLLYVSAFAHKQEDFCDQHANNLKIDLNRHTFYKCLWNVIMIILYM